jgi:tricorn protease
LFDSATYYFNLQWSPDSKLLAFTDNKLDILCLNTGTGKLSKVDTDYNFESDKDLAWSPDSKWLAYTRSLPNRFRTMFLYSVDSGRSTQVTDATSDVRYPAFDKDGHYLYFTASTNYGPTTSGLDMSSDQQNVTRHVYALVLSSEGTSPVVPESDEEKPAAQKVEAKNPPSNAALKPVRIDLAGC